MSRPAGLASDLIGGSSVAHRHGLQRRRTLEPPPKSLSTEGVTDDCSRAQDFQQAEARQAVHPGGTVDRVVRVGGGDYNVHIIGVNWPHHVFLTSGFHAMWAE